MQLLLISIKWILVGSKLVEGLLSSRWEIWIVENYGREKKICCAANVLRSETMCVHCNLLFRVALVNDGRLFCSG